MGSGPRYFQKQVLHYGDGSYKVGDMTSTEINYSQKDASCWVALLEDGRLVDISRHGSHGFMPEIYGPAVVAWMASDRMAPCPRTDITKVGDTYRTLDLAKAAVQEFLDNEAAT